MSFLYRPSASLMAFLCLEDAVRLLQTFKDDSLALWRPQTLKLKGSSLELLRTNSDARVLVENALVNLGSLDIVDTKVPLHPSDLNFMLSKARKLQSLKVSAQISTSAIPIFTHKCTRVTFPAFLEDIRLDVTGALDDCALHFGPSKAKRVAMTTEAWTSFAPLEDPRFVDWVKTLDTSVLVPQLLWSNQFLPHVLKMPFIKVWDASDSERVTQRLLQALAQTLRDYDGRQVVLRLPNLLEEDRLSSHDVSLAGAWPVSLVLGNPDLPVQIAEELSPRLFQAWRTVAAS